MFPVAEGIRDELTNGYYEVIANDLSVVAVTLELFQENQDLPAELRERAETARTRMLMATKRLKSLRGTLSHEALNLCEYSAPGAA